MATVATNGTQVPQPQYKPRYIDIGINLADPIFRGKYHGTQRHPDDLRAVLSRAKEAGCTKLIVTGSSIKSSRDALTIAAEYPGTVFTTAGIHPCVCSIFGASHTTGHAVSDAEDDHTPTCETHDDGPNDGEQVKPAQDDLDLVKSDAIINHLTTLIKEAQAQTSSTPPGPARLVALGEIGLDYDRLIYCPAPVQRHAFAAQLRLAATLSPQLPLFLHSRAAHADFVAHLREAFGPGLERLERGGVVHSFTGTAAEMRELVGLGLHVGVNGCSFKTEENCAVVAQIPLDRIMLETDGPWCEIRQSHAGWRYLVKAAGKAKQEPAAEPQTGAGGVSNGDRATLNPTTEASRAKAGKKQTFRQGSQPRTKEPEVPGRFKVVKKDRWEEGAMVKGRNEPCTIERVATVVAGVKGILVEQVCEAAWANTVKMFGLEETERWSGQI